MNYAFEILDLTLNEKNNTGYILTLSGRALTNLHNDDSLFYDHNGVHTIVKVKEIIFRGSNIDQIESPHGCIIVINTPMLPGDSLKYLYR